MGAIAVQVEVDISDLSAFKLLAKEMVETVQEEAGTKVYDWYLSADETTGHIYERYADNAAALTHLAGFGNFADRFMACCTPTAVRVYGEPNAEVKGILDQFGAVYFAPLEGFAK